MTRLRPRRKQPKEEVIKCATVKDSGPLDGMVLKRKSDHSMAPNTKARVQ